MILSGSRLLRSLIQPCQRYNYLCVTSCTTVRPISTTLVLLHADYLSHKRNTIAVDEAGEVMWVSKRLGGVVAGKGGATLRDIMGRTNAAIEVDFKGVKDDEVPVRLQGSHDECAEARKLIDQLLNASYGAESTVWVPAGQAGILIGKGGAKITSLQKDTGTRILFQTDLKKGGLVPLTISGEPEKCAEAKAIIERLLLARRSKTTVWVPKDKLQFIVGNGGANITSLEKDTHTTISQKEDFMKDGLVPCSIIGEPKNCAEAKDIIEQLIAVPETTVWVPEDKLHFIVGRGGAKILKIRSLEKYTGTTMFLKEELMKDGLVPCSIIGEPKNCAEAKDIIEQLIALPETTLWVPKDKLSLIIGKGGAKIISLRKDTGTTISLKEELMEDGLVPCSIIGEPEKCAEAKAIIEQLILGSS